MEEGHSSPLIGTFLLIISATFLRTAVYILFSSSSSLLSKTRDPFHIHTAGCSAAVDDDDDDDIVNSSCPKLLLRYYHHHHHELYPFLTIMTLSCIPLLIFLMVRYVSLRLYQRNWDANNNNNNSTVCQRRTRCFGECRSLKVFFSQWKIRNKLQSLIRGMITIGRQVRINGSVVEYILRWASILIGRNSGKLSWIRNIVIQFCSEQWTIHPVIPISTRKCYRGGIVSEIYTTIILQKHLIRQWWRNKYAWYHPFWWLIKSGCASTGTLLDDV